MWETDPFQERQETPMSGELFATAIAARLRSQPGIIVEFRRGLELGLSVRGRAAAVKLDVDYQRYRDDPSSFSNLVGEVLARVERDQPVRESDQAAGLPVDRLMPLLVSPREWDKMEATGLHPIVRPLLHDLGVGLVLDEATAVKFLEMDQARSWKYELAQLFERAEQNLERRSRQIQTVVHGQGVETLLTDTTRDGYAATRAILPSRLDEWQRRLPGMLIVALPTQSLMLGFSRDHPALAELRAQVQRDASALPDGLYPELLAYRDGALTLFDSRTA